VSAPETVVVGRVGKSHGLDGSFVVENASDAPERFEVGAELIVEGAPAKVVARRHARGRPVIRLDRRVPRGAQLEVPQEALAAAGEDEYYVFQLVGLRVEEEGGNDLGTVTDVVPGVVNDVLELDSGIALPMVEDCVRAVDLSAGRITVAPGFSAFAS
jgi:16S rRNA processing protein RimM